MRNQLVFFLTHPLFIRLILFFSIFVFLSPIDKYKTTLIEKHKTPHNHHIYYVDLDGDGESEKIDINNNFENQVSLIVSNSHGIINQWNFDGKLVGSKTPFWAPKDSDESSYIVLFTFWENSIRLHCIDPLNKGENAYDKRVSHYTPPNAGLDCAVKPVGFIDNNKDGFKEFYFSIISGFNPKPRGLYVFNLADTTLKRSATGCMNFNNPFAVDVNNDGAFEFGTSTQATANCDSGSGLSDYFTFFCLLDKNLDFVFEPVKIGQYPSSLEVVPVNNENETEFAALDIYMGDKNIPCAFSIFNAKGELEREKEFEFDEAWARTILINRGLKKHNTFFVRKKTGVIEQKNIELETVDTIELMPLHYYIPFALDIDLDNKDEYIFVGQDREQLLITRNDFRHPICLDIRGNDEFRHVSIILKKDQRNLLYLVCDQYSYVFRYSKNQLYYLKYLLYVALYVIIFLFILGIQLIQKIRDEKKYQAERKIAELQIKGLKNQIDPHFTLNIINSIGSLYGKNDTEQADYIFGKYSKMLRTTILNSDHILTTLEDEIEYVKNYMELEKFRLRHGLEYEIQRDEHIDCNLEIPKMLIHTFVENAIKHGLRHLDKTGCIKIYFYSNDDSYEIEITDNGIGRQKAKEFSQYSTHQGLRILDQILEHYFELEKKRISYSIIDDYDANNNAIGTRVIIQIDMKN